MTSLAMNVIYIVLNMPITMLYFFIDFSDLFIELTANVVMINYGVKLFVLLALNEHVRKELVKMLFFKSQATGPSNQTSSAVITNSNIPIYMETFL